MIQKYLTQSLITLNLKIVLGISKIVHETKCYVWTLQLIFTNFH